MEGKEKSKYLVPAILVLLCFAIGYLIGTTYSPKETRVNKPDTNDKAKPIEEDYSKYVSKNWTDENDVEWFYVKSIENGLISFTWDQFRIGGLEAENLPIEYGKAKFYYQGYDDTNYNTEEDEGEHYYRKGTVTLADNKIYVNLENVTQEEFESNSSLDLTDNFGGSVYYELKDYVYDRIVETEEVGENPFDPVIENTSIVYTSDNASRSFIINEMGDNYITFTWYLTNCRIYVDRAELVDGKAKFYYSGYPLKHVERRHENIDEPYYKRGLVELIGDEVHVTIQNISEDEYSESTIYEIATLLGLAHDINPGEYVYTKTEDSTYNNFKENENTTWFDKSGESSFSINTVQDDLVSISWNQHLSASINSTTIHLVDGKGVFYYYIEPDDLGIHIYRKGTVEIVNNELFVTLQNVPDGEYYENQVYDISSSFEGRDNLVVGTWPFAR